MRNSVFGKVPLVPLAVCLMIGIIVANHVPITIPLLPVMAGMVVMSWLLYKYVTAQSIAIMACFLLLGMGVMQYHQRAGEEPETSSYLDRSKTFFLQQRAHLLERMTESGLDGEAYAIVAAMSLGDKSAVSRDLKDTYSVSGASHVLALSGLHLGIIYMLLSLFLPRRRWPALSQLFTILVVWAFVFLVGMSVSVVRSAIMLTIYGLLTIGQRRKMSVNVLAFSAMVMLLFKPVWLFDVGFQMSFLAVLAILLFVPLFVGVFPEGYLLQHRCLRWVWGMIAVSCSAQLGVAPLIAFYFGRFSTYFLLTNFIVIPAAFVILWLSLVVMLFPPLAYLLLYIVQWLNRILRGISALPGSSIEYLHPTVFQVAMIYVIIFCCYLLIERIRPVRGWSASR